MLVRTAATLDRLRKPTEPKDCEKNGRRNSSFFLYIKKFNASVGKGGYLPQSDRDDEDTLKTAAVFNRAEK